MKRAYLMEMTILKSYVRQLLGLGLFVCLCMCIGMENLVSAPGILTMMLFYDGFHVRGRV